MSPSELIGLPVGPSPYRLPIVVVPYWYSTLYPTYLVSRSTCYRTVLISTRMRIKQLNIVKLERPPSGCTRLSPRALISEPVVQGARLTLCVNSV